jgi:hypothetical protein
LADALCTRVEALLRKHRPGQSALVTVRQVKSKFGDLRFYWQLTPAPARRTGRRLAPAATPAGGQCVRVRHTAGSTQMTERARDALSQSISPAVEEATLASQRTCEV